MAKKKYIIAPGTQFGTLSFVGDVETPPRTLRRALFKCACGETFETHVASVKAGLTKSCGCLQDASRRRRKPMIPLRESITRHELYGTWMGMLKRCSNPAHKNYKSYGGRGISVCERWRNFHNFVADIGARPSPGHSVDRIEVNGNYEPGNCRWATLKEQANNRQNSFYVVIGGRKQTLTIWCEEIGIHKETVRRRLKAGWSAEDALTRPPRPLKKRGAIPPAL